MSLVGSRYAHPEGRVSVEYGRRGNKVYTLGQDGEMRIWAAIDDDDCENVALGEEGLALAVANDRIFVSTSETNNVQAVNMEGDSDGIITKFTADATCLDTIASGCLLAAGSADMTVKVSDTVKYTDKVLSGHTGPILSVALDPLKKFVGSSSCDGTVRIWEISSKTQVKSMNCVPKSNDVVNSKTLCRLRFSKSGAHLAVPANGSVTVLARDSWQEVISLTVPDLKEGEIFTCVAWNASGELVLAGTSKGNLCLWNVDGKVLQVIETERNYEICALDWNPKEDEEACFGDSKGFWGVVGSLGSSATGTATEEAALLSQEELGELFNDDDDENSFSISKVRAETGFAEDEEGHLVHADAAVLGPVSSRPGSAASSHPASFRDAPGGGYRPAPVQLQPSFQPGASPDHFEFRFLVYNEWGMVKTVQDNGIDVSFHDIATHYNLFFRNPENYTMAALTDKLLVLARQGDDEAAGKVAVNNFKTTDSEWSIELAEDERVLGVAAGDGWVAAATSKNFLRLFTSHGIQREVISLVGPLVSMAGGGSKLFMATHSAHPLPDQQNFSYYVLNVDFRRGLSRLTGPAHLAVTPGSELYWVGVSDTRLPVTGDSTGMVRMLLNNAWYPICDTKAGMTGKSDTFYLTCVDHKDLQVRGVKCRGRRYPPTFPLPSPASLPINAPFCATGERAELEQKLLSSALLRPLAKTDPELEADTSRKESECLMKLFALACRGEQDGRALEVCKLMPDPESIQMAIQYAAKIKRVGLASKLGELALELQEKEDNDAEAETGEVDELNNDDDDDFKEDEEGSQTESQDMFADCSEASENPLLKAMTKKQESTWKPAPVPSRQGARNPFAKKIIDKKNVLSSSPGSKIVFDSARNQPEPLRPNRVVTIPKPKTSKVAKKEKENTSEETGELKGFQLFLAESKDSYPGTQEETQEKALQAWKSMDKSAKDKYKTSRVPNLSSGKRKRSEDDSTLDEKKKTKPSFASKLAGFAFSGGD